MSPSPRQTLNETVSARVCVFVHLYLCPFDSQWGIGVTACLLSNRLTNNLLRGIRGIKKGGDHLCLSLFLSITSSHCFSTPLSLFLPFCRFPYAFFLLSHCSLLLLSHVFFFKILLSVAVSTHAQMHITLKCWSVLMMSEVTVHTHKHTAYQTLMQ